MSLPNSKHIKIEILLTLLFILTGGSLFGQTVIEISSIDLYTNHFTRLSKMDVPIIDGRTDSMHHAIRIKGSIQIDADKPGLTESLKSHLNGEKVIIYCTTSRRSRVIVDSLKTFYSGTIYFMDDGITGWIKNNLPTIESPSPNSPKQTK